MYQKKKALCHLGLYVLCLSGLWVLWHMQQEGHVALLITYTFVPPPLPEEALAQL